jgi:hypothetical protein
MILARRGTSYPPQIKEVPNDTKLELEYYAQNVPAC